MTDSPGPPWRADAEMRDLERFAMEGFGPAAEARVLALHRVGDFAGVWVGTSDETGQGDLVVIAERRDRGWLEMTSSSACTTWSGFLTAQVSNQVVPAQGVLAVLGKVEAPSIVRVQCGDADVTVTPDGLHFVALFVGVASDAGYDVRITAVAVDSDR